MTFREACLTIIFFYAEQLVLSITKDVKYEWQKDYEQYVKSVVVENAPCYVLFKFDSKNSLGDEWLFISWSPDSATVRQKMLYASTKATLKMEFGTSQIKEELHGTVLVSVHMRIIIINNNDLIIC